MIHFRKFLSDICGHISSELGVAAVTVDTDQYGDDVTPIVVDSDCVKVKMVGVGSAQAYAVFSTPNICMKSQIRKEYNMDFIIYFLQGTLCMAAIAAGFSFICWLSTKIFKDN